jgi:hypothetical protein
VGCFGKGELEDMLTGVACGDSRGPVMERRRVEALRWCNVTQPRSHMLETSDLCVVVTVRDI